MSIKTLFNKEDINYYLNELAKILSKKIGKGRTVEIVIVGGASILINHNFRTSSSDIDYTSEQNIVKECINEVADKFDLDNGWMNNDFVRTNSYSYKLYEFSVYYKTFQHCLIVRTVAREYLLATKLMSFRLYKNDLSDIISIIQEEKEKGNYITFDIINNAVTNLYGGWNKMPEDSCEFAKRVTLDIDLSPYLKEISNLEKDNKNKLLEVKKEEPSKFNDLDIEVILKKLNF